MKGLPGFDYLSLMLSTRIVATVGLSLLPGLLAGASVTDRSNPTLPEIRPQEPLDVGSFTLFLRDQRAGREQFSMHRVNSASGAALELRAESAMGERRAAIRLEADSAGTPLRYTVEERTGASVTLRLGGQRVRGRFTTLARSVSGEAAREYLLEPGAMVLEDNGVLQYALIVRRPLQVGDSITIPVLTPIANRQGTVHLALQVTSDTVIIAGSHRIARRWRLTTSTGETRFIWADSLGRLLRVQIPARSFDALRDDAPP